MDDVGYALVRRQARRKKKKTSKTSETGSRAGVGKLKDEAATAEEEDVLIVERSPTKRAIIVCFGMAVLGFLVGLWHLSSYAGWVFFFATACLASAFWPETQTCEFTRTEIRRWNTPLFARSTPRTNVYNAAEAASVRVHEEILRYASRGRQVIVDLEDGTEVLVTSFCTLDNAKHHRKVAAAIADFLRIPVLDDNTNEPAAAEATSPSKMPKKQD